MNIKAKLIDLRGYAIDILSEGRILYQKYIRDTVVEIVSRAQSDRKERNRILIVLFSSLFILDYCMFCLHSDKNIFSIFPSIPPLEKKKDITVYLPALDGKSTLVEKRSVPIFDSEEKYAKYLFKMVVKGSVFENTAATVPLNLFVRKVWIYNSVGGGEKYCLIDIEPSILDENVEVIKGSEDLFKRALDKTITENIASIKKVLLLEKGIPYKRIWEI